MSEESNCFFCGSECTIHTVLIGQQIRKYNCGICGEYLLDEEPGKFEIDITDSVTKFKMACLLNERRLRGLGGVALENKLVGVKQVNGLSVITINSILSDFPDKASDFITRALLNLSRIVRHPFEHIELTFEPTDKFLLFSQEPEQADFFLQELERQGWVASWGGSNGWDFWSFTLTGKCWELIDNLTQKSIDSKNVFVAMWFDKAMADVYEYGIKPAIKKAGYIPVRIDLKEFNGKVCDEILAEIKRCKFLISDFSGQRGGVYFEAGFAMGQGKPVIWAVQEEDVKNLHFDTRQYKHIIYTTPDDLREKLYNRICATID